MNTIIRSIGAAGVALFVVMVSVVVYANFWHPKTENQLAKMQRLILEVDENIRLLEQGVQNKKQALADWEQKEQATFQILAKQPCQTKSLEKLRRKLELIQEIKTMTIESMLTEKKLLERWQNRKQTETELVALEVDQYIQQQYQESNRQLVEKMEELKRLDN